ncbi:MAG: GNAT family N-acetyltransferase [Verrucomicrobium sp.]|nr:GNAT family N-acetyltransferase [Verrucomicrobium sp.]
MTHPVLRAERLFLDAFRAADAPAVQRLAGDREVAQYTQFIPHPYPDGEAERWIATHGPEFQNGTNAAFAVRLPDGALVGAIAVKLHLEARRGVLGYWIGREFWGRGYATEAARALLGYAFPAWGLEKVEAVHMEANPASGRVMEKLGMRRTGARLAVCRDPEAVPIVEYALHRSGFSAAP